MSDSMEDRQDGRDEQAAAHDAAWGVYERALLVVLALTLAASCWLLSAEQGVEEGHLPWRPGSVLRAITTLMALNFEYPTLRGTEVKWLVAGAGTAALLLLAGLIWYRKLVPASDDDGCNPPAIDRPAPSPASARSLTPQGVAQGAAVLLVGWTLLSALWAPWPAAAWGEGLRLGVFVVWALVLGRCLSRASLPHACRAVFAVLALTAVVGLWYYFERNPHQRLKFPIGNPIFLAACLLPGITLGLGQLVALTRWRPLRGSGGAWRWAGLAATAVGLIALVWAFDRADARGPQVGLFAGVAAAVFVLAGRRVRRVILAAGAIALVAAIVSSVTVGPPSFLTRRAETVLFRAYAWRYAGELWSERPIVGQGQGAYVLKVQQMADADAREHPTLFVGDIVGHAHNEWLEILAELGIVGFALVAVALGATLVGLVRNLRQARTEHEHTFGFGLLAGLVGLIVTEATDVGLRMPGLPIVFWTVVALAWVRVRPATGNGWTLPVPYRRAAGIGGLGAALVGAAFIGTSASLDFQGALAQRQSAALADRGQWDAALEQAALAQRGRWSIEGRLAAAHQFHRIAHEAAADRFARLARMLGRFENPGQIPANVRTLAAEDHEAFELYAAACLGSGIQLLNWMPGYPWTAGRMAETLLMKHRVEAVLATLGLVEQAGSYLQAAYHWMRTEYERDPYEPWSALRLFGLVGQLGRPMEEQLDVLRVALRGGPRPPGESADAFRVGVGRFRLDLFGEFESALASLLGDENYRTRLEAWLEQAEAAVRAGVSSNGSSDARAIWPDKYVPETLRLAARDRKLTRRFAEAAELADLAARASERIVDRFPESVSNARIDQCRYLLLSAPEAPERAVDACREAIDRWPMVVGDRVRGLRLRQSLAFYLLAAGREADARQVLADLAAERGQTLTAAQLDRLVGYGLGEVCLELAGALPAEQRPASYSASLARSIELVDDWPETRMLAAFEAFEAGRSADGVAHLARMEQLIDDPPTFAGALRMVLQAFPEDAALAAFAQPRLEALADRMPPAATGSAPATGPETVPAPAPRPPLQFSIPQTSPSDGHPRGTR